MTAKGQRGESIWYNNISAADRRRRGRRERRVQEIVNVVQSVMEQTILADLLPRSEIEIFLQILQADGSEKAACINAAMLAIANAGKDFCFVLLSPHSILLLSFKLAVLKTLKKRPPSIYPCCALPTHALDCLLVYGALAAILNLNESSSACLLTIRWFGCGMFSTVQSAQVK